MQITVQLKIALKIHIEIPIVKICKEKGNICKLRTEILNRILMIENS